MHPPTRRIATLAHLLGEFEIVRPGERVLIALDGVDGMGKSHLARELVELSEAEQGRPIVSVSIDGFHRPRHERLAAGNGPEGFYHGSYRYDAFRENVVRPVQDGTPIRPAVCDVAADEPVTPMPRDVPAAAIVLVDGIFLQRPELADVWDAVVWVDAPFEVTVPRGNARFPGRVNQDPESAANRRYVGGQRIYFDEARPAERATWVWDNTVLERPSLRRNP
ncbi:hypothetical protein GCM10010910_05350 [Microbacterium nanhaiense]|uniref:Uridine kinase n=1 Tax=Microbacterium nanhaiense TaxID=1301026 RepID=A0ABQ2MX85_9MICO|nr:uridine kinase [Microbacterium nanhaiense]GGO60292.1 hypothetical protein GCM10010910_05350 [Microbacterium nanhaiense]